MVKVRNLVHCVFSSVGFAVVLVLAVWSRRFGSGTNLDWERLALIRRRSESEGVEPRSQCEAPTCLQPDPGSQRIMPAPMFHMENDFDTFDSSMEKVVYIQTVVDVAL